MHQKHNIDTLLADAGINKRQLADELGISRETVSRWRDDVPQYAVAYLRLLAEVKALRVLARLSPTRQGDSQG